MLIRGGGKAGLVEFAQVFAGTLTGPSCKVGGIFFFTNLSGEQDRQPQIICLSISLL